MAQVPWKTVTRTEPGNDKESANEVVSGQQPLRSFPVRIVRWVYLLALLSAAGLAVFIMPTTAAGQNRTVRWNVAFSHDASFVVTSGDRVRIYNSKSGNLVREIKGEPTDGIAFSAFERDLFAAGGKDGILRLYRIGDQKFVRELKGHRDGIITIAFEKSGRYVASTSSWGDYNKVQRGQLLLWEIETGKLAKSVVVTKGKIKGVSFSNNGKLIAFCRIEQGKASFAEVYQVKTWKKIASIRISADKKQEVTKWGKAVPEGLTTRFTPDNQHLLVGGGICVRVNPHGYNYACRPSQLLWRIDFQGSSSTKLFFSPKRAFCHSIDISPNGQQVVTGNGPIDMRDIANGKLLWTHDGGRGVAISPDGKHVAVGRFDGLLILNAQTGEQIRLINEKQ